MQPRQATKMSVGMNRASNNTALSRQCNHYHHCHFITYNLSPLTNMTEEVDYDSSDDRDRHSDSGRDSPVVIKGRGHARFNRGGDKQSRGGVFETIPQPGLKQGEAAQCKLCHQECYVGRLMLCLGDDDSCLEMMIIIQLINIYNNEIDDLLFPYLFVLLNARSGGRMDRLRIWCT